MTDKEIVAIAALLANHSVYQTALTSLLIDKGVLTQAELTASIEEQIKGKVMDNCIDAYILALDTMTKEKPPEGGE